MAITNTEVAEKFNRLANLLEIEGANPFRVRAYRNAARMIANLTKSVAELLAQGEDLTELPGIGNDLADKIAVLVKTGELPLLKQIEKRIPPLLNELMKIEGLGPKRVQLIYKKLKIKSIKDLEIAIEKGRLRKIHGFGQKTEQKILQSILNRDQYAKRAKLADMFPVVDTLMRYLKKHKAVIQAECAGSFRRRKETVGDLDILITTEQSAAVLAHFLKFIEIAEIISQGPTRSTIRLRSGIQVDLRIVHKNSYGSAMVYFTGSKDHNIAIRKIAVRNKLKINEYGVFKGKKQIAGKTEADVYAQVDLPYIEPELREDRGEIKAAQQNQLPKLITLNQIHGDLHCHTLSPDHRTSLEAIAKAAETLNYSYIAIADHALDKKTLLTQMKSIDQLNRKLKKLVILKSVTIDILEDGSLSLPNDLLKELDFTVCAIHSAFNLSQKKQTERIIRAMDNPYFNLLAHPTGRLINSREPYPVDMEQLLLAAKERGCILELNAQPERLDLNDIHCKTAKEIGVKIAINTAAHNVTQLEYMQFGIYQARRGWLEKEDVINTQSLSRLKKLLRR